MSIRFRCYSCLKKIACPEKGMGLYLACPHCGARVRVPIPADLGEFTVEEIKANQKAQIKRAKQKQRGGVERPERPTPQPESAPQPEPVAQDGLPVARVKRADSVERESVGSSEPGTPVVETTDGLPVARVKDPSKIHPAAEEPDMLEVEMAGGDEGPNETDDLLASLARAAGDEASDGEMDMAMEYEPVSDVGQQAQPDDGAIPAELAGEDDSGDAADLLAELAAAAEDDEPAPRSKDKGQPRGKRSGRRR
ncbi:MAG: hypothetical protein AAF750_17125 [Planctomycetota bacterium]